MSTQVNGVFRAFYPTYFSIQWKKLFTAKQSASALWLYLLIVISGFTCTAATAALRPDELDAIYAWRKAYILITSCCVAFEG